MVERIASFKIIFEIFNNQKIEDSINQRFSNNIKLSKSGIELRGVTEGLVTE